MIVLLRIEAPRTRVRDIYTEKATTAIAPWIEIRCGAVDSP